MWKPLLIAFATGTAALIASALFISSVPQKVSAIERYGNRKPSEPLERLDLIQAVREARRPRVGEVAEDLDVADEIGARFHLKSRLDRPLLLGAFCSCGACRRTAAAWSRLHARYPAQFSAAALLALPKGDALYAFHDSLQVNFPLIPDPNHALSARYPGAGEGSAALGCPRAWVIGKDGRYRYVMAQGSEPTPEVLRSVTKALGLKQVPETLLAAVTAE
jgi:peroxiredoxin